MKHLILAAAASLFASCSLFFPSPLEVADWSPGESVVPDPAGATVSVTFSRDADRIIAESAFSFRIDGEIIGGTFSWPDDSTVVFSPYHPLGDGLRHEIRVNASCEDLFGNSLEEDFSAVFSVSADETRPRVTGIIPGDGAVTDDPAVAIVMDFSEAMDPVTVMDAFSLSPAVPLVWTWNASGDSATLTPMFDLSWGEEYAVALGAEAADRAGNTLGTEFTARFTLGSDVTPPTVLSLAPYADGGIVPDPGTIDPSLPGAVVTFGGFEASWHLALDFDEAVDLDALVSRVSFSPALGFEIDGSGFSATAVVRLTDRPVHGATYRMLLSEGYKDAQDNEGDEMNYYFTVNGPLTTPPRIDRIVMPSSPGAGTVIDLYDWNGGSPVTFPSDLSGYGAPGDVFLAVYLTVSDAANQDPYATWMEFERWFSLSVNNDIGTFTFNGGKPDTLGGEDGEPAPAADQILVKMYYTISDDSGSGSLDLELGDGFADSLGNPLAGDWAIRLY